MSQFSTEHTHSNGVDIIALRGTLDAHTSPDFEQTLGEVIEKSSAKRIVVNFEALDYISSAGLGVFMVYIEDIRDEGGDIKLSGMSAKVFNVFDLLGFPMLFEIVNSNEEAVNKFISSSQQDS